MNTTASLLPVQAVRNNLPGMLDLILRGRRVLDGLIRDERALPQTTQQLLALALLGIAVHGLVLGVAAHLLPPEAVGPFSARGTPALWMPLAFMGSFLGALCICGRDCGGLARRASTAGNESASGEKGALSSKK